MKVSLRYLLILLSVLGSLRAAAQDEPVDTVYFYASWEQMFYLQPDTMIVDPMIDVYSPFELYFESSDRNVNKRIKKEYVSATLGDSIWLINSQYLKDNFKGDSKKLHGYVPLLFNDKVAYAVAEEYFFSDVGGVGYNVYSTHNFYIDFEQFRVTRLDAKALTALLADYPDLRMRYEGMKENDKSAILNDFFNRFIERAENDVMRPYILDLVE